MASASAPSEQRPTTVFLVRHGQTTTTGEVLPGRVPHLHLSDVGAAQATRAADRLRVLPQVNALYSSPMERAQQTAEPIANAFGLATTLVDGLIEADFGDWTGRRLDDLRQLPEWNIVQRAPSTFRFPGGESFTEIQARMVTTLDRLRTAHPGGTIVCVSHADTIKAAMAHTLGTHLDLFQRIVISTCSISAISWGPDGPIALCVNSCGDPLDRLVPS